MLKMEKGKDFDSLWGKKGVEMFRLPPDFPLPEDPLEWALDFCRKEDGLAGTAMKWVFGDQDDSDDSMVYVSRGNVGKEQRSKLIEGVRKNASIQLQVAYATEKIDLLRKFVEENFRERLNVLYPFGFCFGSDLFVTGAEHTYDAHCDSGDTVLVQLHGRKLLRCWGPSEAFYDRVIFDYDHRGKPELFKGQVQEFILEPGHAIYFQRGMMHEVTVLEGDQSVSLSLCPWFTYPVLEVIRDLCREVGDEDAFDLPEDWKHWDKFRCKVFNPSDFIESLSSEEGSRRMPISLKSEILKVLKAKNRRLQDLQEFYLDRWWKKYCEKREYSPSGPTPTPPSNRLEILRKWESERLSKK